LCDRLNVREVALMSDQRKKRYIKYTPGQLAAVPSPAQQDKEGDGVVRSSAVGTGIGAVAGTVIGIGPAAGALAGGTAGVVKGASDESKK
jgi:hypothetical protein